MRWEIATSAASAIRKHAAAAHPLEACGLLLGVSGRIDTAQPTRNVSAEPSHSFEIDPAALFAAQRAEREGSRALIGYYHSHPNGQALPSARDAARAAPDGKLWIIAAGDTLAAYLAGEGGHEGRFRPITLVERER